ncbi:crossover junction endodeoxyribonuclease RuvC [Candidatus Aerophobetes bacterium]|uniref:Crossover junction endodeoxyribonuclease RuvC n=1 Tax=Aerophobetes bacterium TaxID=2030807 RepID=A0A2A4X5Q5_UNCAE|nr:MAG: crossover junction endodeoxyribonuclease RuvC [Candidatus Aerophobetes bacterium]
MKEVKKTFTVLGIDPGTNSTGYGILSQTGSSFSVIDYGCIKPPRSKPIEERNLIMFEGICALLDAHTIHAFSVESQYVSKNPQSAIKLGMAKGIALLAATMRGLPTMQFAPSQAKLAVTGSGRASKEGVQKMIKTLLSLDELPPDDAADALALAFCYFHHQKPITTQKTSYV